MKSGYCQNSECVVNTARKVLAKKQQLESSDILFEKIDLSSTGEMARKKRTEVLSNWLVNADENKENKPKDDLTEDKEMPKKAALENQFQRTSQKQQHNPPLKERKQNTSVATRVYVEAESSKLSNMSIEGAAYKGISPDFKVIPTNWALIQDTTVNSVRFTTNLSARVIPCADDKPCLKRVDSCVISHAGTMGSSDTLDAFRVQTSEESLKSSNKIIVVPKEINSRANDAFLVAAVKVLVDKELHKIQNLNRGMFVHQRIVDFCRIWIRSKPDALCDFVVYRPKEAQSCQINKIMCGIPGPKRTDWEGGLYPVLLEWSDVNLPPLCRFPKHFHHANVCPATGAAMLSTFTSNEWHPEITIPEILFDLQQLLVHATHKVPSLDDNKEYQFKTKIQTSMYTPKSLLDTAIEIEGFGDPCTWQIVDGRVLAFGGQRDHNMPDYCPEEPEFNNGVFALDTKRVMCKDKCSCCVYGQSLWDKKHEMRFLFGTGMFELP